MDIVCRTTEVGGLPTLMASGELDLATVPAFRSAVNRLVDDASGRTVAIDLDGLTVLDDAGLGILLGAADRARAQGGDVVLVCTGARLRDRFLRSGLARAIEVRDRLHP